MFPIFFQMINDDNVFLPWMKGVPISLQVDIGALIWVYLNMLDRVYNIEIYMISYTLQKTCSPYWHCHNMGVHVHLIFVDPSRVKLVQRPHFPFYIPLLSDITWLVYVGFIWFYHLSQFICPMFIQSDQVWPSPKRRCGTCARGSTSDSRQDAAGL